MFLADTAHQTEAPIEALGFTFQNICDTNTVTEGLFKAYRGSRDTTTLRSQPI
jgi:hypothetical protein